MKNALACAALAACTPAFAAPLVTDDAGLTTAGSCQLESWTRTTKSSTEVTTQLSCNPTGNFEVTLGQIRARNRGEAGTTDHVLQVKTVFKELTPDGWGWGLAAGRIRHPASAPGPNAFGNTFFYVPLSFSTHKDKVNVHVNLGGMKDKDTQEKRMTWGVGAEIKASPHILLMAETFGDNKTRPYWQAGARYSVIPDLFQIDATMGQQFTGPRSGRWISFGLRFTPDRIF
ncbi:MAG: hypothetical protein Q8K31_01990 [Burkholderiaceae bacterium]|nr:hypothetical protein [Burkholderiaceae bacterium]MDO9089733.1 hypothetical protein [Burkholderiaceae bacterium]MDP1967945.1 hypothetical protein [Burkholderiaceae bacterium]